MTQTNDYNDSDEIIISYDDDDNYYHFIKSSQVLWYIGQLKPLSATMVLYWLESIKNHSST